MPTPDRTSLAEIVAAGRDLLEVGGPSRVTMQAVSERVGVRAPSLYKRVRDRDALILLLAEATADELGARLEASDGTLAGLARAYRAFAHERPEAFRLLFTVSGAAEPLARVSAPVLRAARDLVGEARALDAARLLTAWATGHISMELAGAFRLGGDIDEAFEFGIQRIAAGLRT
ncbi:TetR/AcrR family transcriptional regulator [Microbacterium ulmi]|uniref:TetR family transcriptional regulator n=1 Tax=Microbacterium ulmi TaxID=179095 RepID=A0A7Y2M1P0_9MICO|nr:TetR/AcrR family transcriptional regulator [Microbacterium ulmi]NII70206.1 AcrR family transcriptional regulator [Microbacterium ulmi]NNH04532.1 TetR family transcriptional regulator [Microbacterium ulmi]